MASHLLRRARDVDRDGAGEIGGAQGQGGGRRHAPLDVRLADPPLRHQPVGGRALVQHARRLAVDVAVVLLGDDPELAEVEVRVQRLQRVERPLDQVVALGQRPLPLRQLQRPAQAAVAVFGQHAEHVRPLQHLPGLHADDRVDEADHAVGWRRRRR